MRSESGDIQRDRPRRRLVSGEAIGGSQRWRKKRRGFHADVHCSTLPKLHFARVRSNLHAVGSEVDQMASAIRDVASASTESVHPTCIAERAINFGVHAAPADA